MKEAWQELFKREAWIRYFFRFPPKAPSQHRGVAGRCHAVTGGVALMNSFDKHGFDSFHRKRSPTTSDDMWLERVAVPQVQDILPGRNACSLPASLHLTCTVSCTALHRKLLPVEKLRFSTSSPHFSTTTKNKKGSFRLVGSFFVWLGGVRYGGKQPQDTILSKSAYRNTKFRHPTVYDTVGSLTKVSGDGTK